MAITIRGISVNDRTGFGTDKGEQQFVVVYKVSTADPETAGNDWTISAADVLTAPGIPNFGEPFIGGQSAEIDTVMVRKDAEQVENSPDEWLVTCTYRREADATTGVSGPCAAYPKFRVVHDWEAVQDEMVTWDQDTTEDPIPADDGTQGAEGGQGGSRSELLEQWLNIDPSAEIVDKDLTVKRANGEKDVLSFRQEGAILEIECCQERAPIITKLMSFKHTVNKTTFLGGSPRTWQMLTPEVRSEESKNANFGHIFIIKWRLAYKVETWDVQKEERGTYYWVGGKPADPSSKEPKTVLDATGNPIEVPLTADGDLNTTGTPVFSRKKALPEVDFNQIGICVAGG